MPKFLLLPFVGGLFAFDWLPLLRHHRTFSDLDIELQRRIVREWAESRFGRKRDFIKLVRSCSLFFYLDHPLVRVRLEAAPDTAGVRGGRS